MRNDNHDQARAQGSRRGEREGGREGGKEGGRERGGAKEDAPGVDELEVDLLQVGPFGMSAQGLAQRDDAFLGADDLALEHHPVFIHHAVVGEAAQGVDALQGGRGVRGRKQGM
jgi:hypothetical protein